MDPADDESPANRALHRLLTLAAHSDEAGNGCALDPWPFAELGRAMRAAASEGPILERWREAYPKFKEAQDAYAGPFLRSPQMQLIAAEHCLDLKERIAAGDGGAVLDAIAQCAAHGLVLPAWLAVEYLRRHQAVIRGEAKDWNSATAFGPAHPKRTNVAGVRAFKIDAPHAYEVATALLAEDPTQPIDIGLFEAVGQKIGRGKTSVDGLIVAYLADQGGHRPPLTYVRDRLRAGRTLGETFSDWQAEQLDAFHRSLGMEPDAEGVWRHLDDTGN